MPKKARANILEYAALQTPPHGQLLFRIDPIPLESPRGFLCRVAHEHGYNSPSWLADLAGIPPTALERKDRAKNLAHTLRLETLEWLQICHSRVKGKGRFERRLFLGEAIDAFQLNYRHPRICPYCLQEQSVWWAVWDLALVTACPIHRCLLISRCYACAHKLTWNRPAVHTCRCSADLRKTISVPADVGLLAINSAIFHAVGFQRQTYAPILNEANFPFIIADLQLDPLLSLIAFLGSAQENLWHRLPQNRFRSTDLDSTIQIETFAAKLLIGWPQALREMLRCRLSDAVREGAPLNLISVFGNFYLRLLRIRDRFRFVYDAFENFVVEDWNSLIRPPHRTNLQQFDRNSWITAEQAQMTHGVDAKLVLALICRREVEGFLIRKNHKRRECWLNHESLNRWLATLCAGDSKIP